MSTAGPSFADSALTQEASVLVQGAGLVRVASADNPVVFSDPQSLSFGYLDVNAGAASRAIPVTISDAGGGAGAWSVEIQPQVASARSDRLRCARSRSGVAGRPWCRWLLLLRPGPRRATTSAS